MQKNIAIINPEDFGYDLAVLARKLGYAVTGVMVEDPERYRILRDIYCFDSDGNARAYDTLISAEHWEDAVWQLRSINPCAVISGSEIAVDYTDRIASVLGLPCNDPSTIPLRRSKLAMKHAVRDAGLPYAVGDSFSDFAEAAAFVRAACGYPVVVKPVWGAGSKNVSFCRNEEEFADAFIRVQETPDAYLQQSSDVLVEKYISGDEYVVNMMGTADGVFVTDIWKYEKFGNDYSDCVYYNDIMQDMNDPYFDALREYAVKVYHAVGIKIGPAHAEIKLSENGPVMIEIGSRLAGGEMPKYAAMATNCNSLEKTLKVFIDGTADMPEKIIINSYPASADISHECFGRLEKFTGLEQVRRLPSYKAEVLYAKPGDYIEPTRDVDHLAALFWFMSTDRKQVRSDLEKSHHLCTVKTVNNRVLAVATTTDYIDDLRRQFPDRLLFVTAENLRAQAKEKKPLASEEILCNVRHFKDVLAAVCHHEAVFHQHITGITCFDCESLMLASYLAAHLHLPFPSAEAVKNCRSKQRSIALWKKAGLGCPKSEEITSYEQALAFYEKCGRPCVIKPASGSGSEFTFLCRTKAELAASWDTATLSMSEKESDTMYLEQCGGSRDILIQEYAEGTEYSCDFIMRPFSAVILRLCRKQLRSGRFGVTETYELLPESLWPETMHTLSHLLYRAAKTLGRMDHAVIMVDFIETKNGFMLLEMSPRAGGDCIPPLVEAATGCSTPRIAVMLASGEYRTPAALPVRKTYFAHRLFASKRGIIMSQDSTALEKTPGVHQVLIYHSTGFSTDPSARDYNDGLLGCIICESNGTPVQEQTKKLSSLFTPDLVSFEEYIGSFVSQYLSVKDSYISAWNKNGRKPLRIFDKVSLLSHAETFKNAFEHELSDCGFYYAVKCNNYPEVSRAAVSCGYGLDVSSGDELQLALSLSAGKIEFSGPGKTEAELDLAASHAGSVTVLLDSFSELDALAKAAERAHTIVRCGVRMLPPGGWEKFGIIPEDLEEFFTRASSYSSISLDGIQFHTSWNMNSTQQILAVTALSRRLKTWSEDELKRIKFIDIGGGYWPEKGEWLRSPEAETGKYENRTWNRSVPITQFASELAAAVKQELFPLVHCQIRFEPGRWIADSAMHVLVSVADRKSDTTVITDGATNCIGWDRFQSDYCPVINLTHPSQTEHACRLYGSLCDPHDIWGFSYFGSEIQKGDVLLIPEQGAYTYSLQQHFIKPLPPVAEQ